jgi:hypothetical protein
MLWSAERRDSVQSAGTIIAAPFKLSSAVALELGLTTANDSEEKPLYIQGIKNLP